MGNSCLELAAQVKKRVGHALVETNSEKRGKLERRTSYWYSGWSSRAKHLKYGPNGLSDGLAFWDLAGEGPKPYVKEVKECP